MTARSILVGVMLMMASVAQAASTETCPNVDGGEWVEWSVFHMNPTSEYKWKLSTQTCETSEFASFAPGVSSGDGSNGFWVNTGNWKLWLKVPYKIEWKCVEWAEDYPRTFQKCVREVGYREDGQVIWRKP